MGLKARAIHDPIDNPEFIAGSPCQLRWDKVLGVTNGCDWFTGTLKLKLRPGWQVPAVFAEAILKAGYEVYRPAQLEPHHRRQADANRRVYVRNDTRGIVFDGDQIQMWGQGGKWIPPEDDGGIQDGILIYLHRHHPRAVLSYQVTYDNDSLYGPSDRVPVWKSTRATRQLLRRIATERALIKLSWSPFGKRKRDGMQLLLDGEKHSADGRRRGEFLVPAGSHRVRVVIPFFAFKEFTPHRDQELLGLHRVMLRESNELALELVANQTYELRADIAEQDARISAAELRAIKSASPAEIRAREAIALRLVGS